MILPISTTKYNMERLRSHLISKNIKNTIARAGEALRNTWVDFQTPFSSFGVVVAINKLEENPDKTKVFFFSGWQQTNNGQRAPLYDWIVVRTELIEEQNITPSSLIRLNLRKNKMQNLGTIEDIQENWTGKQNNSPH